MEIRYSKLNEFKDKFNNANWNDPSIRLEIMNYLHKAKSEGWNECMDMLKTEGLLSI